MPNFIIGVQEVWNQQYEVDAENEQAALDAMRDNQVEPLNGLSTFDFNYTLDENNWTIQSSEDFNSPAFKVPKTVLQLKHEKLISFKR